MDSLDNARLAEPPTWTEKSVERSAQRRTSAGFRWVALSVRGATSLAVATCVLFLVSAFKVWSVSDIIVEDGELSSACRDCELWYSVIKV